MSQTLSSRKCTWLGYLRKMRHDADQDEQVKCIDPDHFFPSDTFAGSFLRHTIPFVYLLDYRRSTYIYMSENFAGYSSESFLKGGVAHTQEIFHRDHLRVFDQEVFPQRLQFLTGIAPADFGRYVFSYNIRLRNRNGNYENYLQRNCFFADDWGNPIFSMGILLNINDHSDSNRVIQTVDEVSVCGMQSTTLLTEIYCICEEDKLFSKREKEVLLWMADGFSSKMIADKLNISEHTVINHRRSMQEKSNTPNATALVSFAIRSAII